MTGFLVRRLCGLYRLALRAYPADFRRQYGREMAQVFTDRCRSVARSQGLAGLARFSASVAADWAASIVRERASSVSSASSAEPAMDGAPVFYLYGDDRPSTGALLNGGAASVFVFMLISLLIGIGVNHPRGNIIGSHHPSRSNLLPARATAEPMDLPSEVKMQPYPDAVPIHPYFKLLLILEALDTDQDNVISAAEIARAPAALRKLDKAHDGSLSPEECGFRFGKSARAAFQFMRFHPVNAALDADGDGRISAQEIRNAPQSLTNLDSNHDGALTLFELLPHPDAR